MVKKARIIQKAPKVGKLTRRQVKKAVKIVIRASQKAALKDAAKVLKKEVNAALKKFMALMV